jgi:hypothetical protein
MYVLFIKTYNGSNFIDILYIYIYFMYILDQWFSTGVPRHTSVPRDCLGVPREG